jgi:GNAT superfamily N-acetyltransferase
MTSGPFCAADLELGGGALGRVRLRPLETELCAGLAQALAAMPPWSVTGTSAAAMTRYLAAESDGVFRYVIDSVGVPAGAAAVRYPWLKGPYLELLALLPKHQGQGIGTAFLRWFEEEARRHEARNLWVCASRFNAGALAFYRRHGFVETASLPDLVAKGFDEILLRKFPIAAAKPDDV